MYGIESDKFEQATREEIWDYFREKEFIQVDTETTGMDCHIHGLMCLQLGDYDNQFVIHPDLVGEFKGPLERRTLIFHNAKFDLRFLYKLGIYPTKVYDTFLAECVLHCGIPSAKKGLASVAKDRIGIDLDKSVREGIWKKGLIDEVIQYAADDVKYLEKIRESQLVDLRKQDLLDALEMDNQFVLCLAYIELCGFKLNKEQWAIKCEKNKKELEEAKAKIDTYILDNNISRFIDVQMDMFNPGLKCNINWNSSDQVIDLFNILEIPTEIVEEGEEKHSVAAKNIEKYEKEFPFVADYLRYKELQKLVSTYGYNFIEQINPVTGRLHTSFKQIMNTGRLSSGGRDKSLGIKHLNFQNIPSDKETRSCFIAEEGKVLIGCDYTAQEDLVFTQLSQEPKLIAFYNDERQRDGHSFVAKMCFPEKLDGVQEEDIKEKYPEERNMAKTAKFAIHYGGNGSTVAKNLNLPLELGYQIEKSYFESFDGIAKYFNKVKKLAIQRGYILFNPIYRRKSYIFGYRDYLKLQAEIDYDFWERYRLEKVKFENEKPSNYLELKEKVGRYFRLKGSIERKALNYPVQGSSSEVTKLSCIYIWEWIREKGLQDKVLFVNTIHDENVLECPEEMGEEVARMVQECMERAGAVYCTDVKLKAVPTISTYWTK